MIIPYAFLPLFESIFPVVFLIKFLTFDFAAVVELFLPSDFGSLVRSSRKNVASTEQRSKRYHLTPVSDLFSIFSSCAALLFKL
uniref:Uncharacterized protein n=1 Tax=Romanomermis culicivorax TaxID=13658 RepID=A0A915I361_ROMCU